MMSGTSFKQSCNSQTRLSDLALAVLKTVGQSNLHIDEKCTPQHCVRLVSGGKALASPSSADSSAEEEDPYLHTLLEDNASVLSVLSPPSSQKTHGPDPDDTAPGGEKKQRLGLFDKMKAYGSVQYRWLKSLDTKSQLGLLSLIILVICTRLNIGQAGLMPICILAVYAYEDRNRVIPWLSAISIESYAQIAVGLVGLRLAIYVEFGAVYIMMVMLYMVWANLGDGEDGGLSAYSVFNTGKQHIISQSLTPTLSPIYA